MKLGIVMDPIEGINIKKDSSFAMLLAAQSRDWEIYYMEIADLFMDSEKASARMGRLKVADSTESWFELTDKQNHNLNMLDIILMRKDPPFNLEYIYSTYILERAEQDGVLVVNRPAALRDVNEKFFITQFKDCIAPTLVSQDTSLLSNFISEHETVIIKPLDGMAGQGIFKISTSDPNFNVILETATK